MKSVITLLIFFSCIEIASAEAQVKQNQNIEAKRQAANLAKEQRHYLECLRVITDIPPAVLTTNDVRLIGECSSKSLVTPFIISLLEQQTAIPDNRDMASFWLGRYYFYKENYPVAEKYLYKIQLLPERLDIERVKILEKIRTSVPINNAPASVYVPAPVYTPAPIYVAPSPISNSPVINLRTGKVVLTREANLSLPLLLNISLNTDVDYAPNSVSLSPFLQTAYSSDLVSIQYDNWKRASAEVSGTAQYALGVSEKISGTSAITRQLLRVSLAATGSTRKSYLYFRPTVSPYSASLDLTNGSGFWVGGGPELGISFAKDADLLAKVEFFAVGGQLPVKNVININASTRLYGNNFGLALSYDYERISGDLYALINFAQQPGFLKHEINIDLKTSKSSFLGFDNFRQFSLFRYTKSTAGSSMFVPVYKQFEGEFWEVNLTPRLYFNDIFNMFVWYRYNSGKNRPFWSSGDIIKTYKVNDLITPSAITASYEDTARYTSTVTYISGGFEAGFTTNFTGTIGAQFRGSRTKWQEYVPADLPSRTKQSQPNSFRTLLDSGYENSLRAFASVEYNL